MYKSLTPISRTKKALVFTLENWLGDDTFATCERSVYLGTNHLDIQNIERDDESYSWIASNHVVEHVENDRAALKEMFRILANDGILQLTIPTPSKVFDTNDWGFADNTKMGHFRNYGADFALKIHEWLPDSFVLYVFMKDNLTDFSDITYILAKSANIMREIATVLIRGGYVVVPQYPVEA